jgi:membrane-bound lytic murein transglycosylase D
MIETVLDEYGLPTELLAVALIESGLDPNAVSPAGATGMWQFVGTTATTYGLNISEGLDERLIPDLATDAAARHLRDLHESFGDWPLALAAYNAGEHRIRSLCEAAGTTDYWVLRSGDHGLPEETAEYVPKVLAMVTLLRETSSFGFAENQSVPPKDALKLTLPVGVNPWRLGSALGLSKAQLKDLNPVLDGNAVTASSTGRELWVPKDRKRLSDMLQPDLADIAMGRTLLDQLARLAQDEQFIEALQDCVLCPGGTGTETEESWSKLVGVLRSDQQLYRVQSGDTLGRLAKRFGVAEEELRQQNKVTDPRAIQIGSMLLVPSG